MTAIGSSRLDDPLFYPVLLRATLDALNAWEYPGVCVTGLPATMISRQYAERLGDHFRAATADRPVFVEPEGIYVIPEPVCLLYAWLLDDTGAERMPGALRGALRLSGYRSLHRGRRHHRERCGDEGKTV